MSSLSRELVFLILQFLDEEKFKETVHKLEQESGFYFNMKYFEDQVQNGEWDEVERYLSGFTKVDDNRYSMKIFFEIRKQKYLEALDKQDRARAVEILVKDLKVFASFNEDLYKEITQLLTLENFRENEQLSKYGDTKSARNIMLLELKKLIEANPLFREKLQFPGLKASRLRTLINQSLNWQHQLCKNPRPNPDIKTLFVDHTCGAPNGARAPPPANSPLVGSLPKGAGFPPLGAHSPFQPAAPTASALAGWMANPNPPSHPGVVGGPAALAGAPNPAAMLKRPRTPPPAPTVDFQTADSEHLMKRNRPVGRDESDSLNFVSDLQLQVNFPGPNIQQASYTIDDIPKTVARTINQGSCVATMDFHPLQQVILLVGTNVGEIAIWDVATRERLALKTFKVWEVSVCSMPLQTALVKDPAVAVTRVVWSPDGNFIGVAFNKHIVQVYQYFGGVELRQQVEIDAHVGSVNDLAFAHPNKQLCIISCGDDKTIKVWDAVSGRNKYTFEGHEAPVYSVCPHHKENIQFIFSTAMDGKIKAWLYDCLGSRVDYDAPGSWCTTMAYSADGTRLFSCGTSKEGDSFLVEWNESEGVIKRTYIGFRKRMPNVVQFDTTRNCFLAVGDEFSVKFWDMDNINLLTSIDADGGLPASPRIRFNKEGSLLAVTTIDNGFKILANADGLRLLRSFEGNKVPPETKGNVASASGSGVDRPVSQPVPFTGGNGIENGRPETKPRTTDDSNKLWKLTEIVEPSHCRALKLPDTLPASKISRLIFTNNGLGLLALASSAVHKVWKWSRNPLGKATASFPPQLFQPSSGILMTNDTTENNPEEAVPCIALSKNDSYVMSASGGKVSLFNMMTFKVMTAFMPPPPAATFLAFHPQDNNIIAIGMEDSTIQIYNVRVDEVKSKLKGHQKRITGLAFSNVLHVLVSSGADDQLCVWGTDGWEKRKSKFLQTPPVKGTPATGDTKVQFHNDHTRLLVVHETQLAIYDAAKLERLSQWVPKDNFPAGISSGTYSCDSRLVYAAFLDGAIGVFEAETLRPYCRIAPTVYLPQGVTGAHPLVVAAHPSEPNLFALGLTDGSVQVLEPLESEAKWGVAPPAENGSAMVTTSGPPTGSVQVSDQASR
ncbi:hypothetical protein SELMODRAFT_163891 [Selaginella moellendorffii]|uniref:Uncharacterized protein TPLb-1 n=1 Tax=Selaginella moellendorffii TaxID=88036 RepID=D8QQP6_SELML|nr:hypothetical protein SELMODRAFT_163891 [Selaginella moellendorffii]